MTVLKNGSKCSHTKCMLRFFTVFRLALNPDLYFETGFGEVNNESENFTISFMEGTKECVN